MSYRPFGLDEVAGLPVLVAESSPYRVVVIDRDRIIHPYVLHRSPPVLDVLFNCELRRVPADHDQSLILVLLAPRADIRKGAEPVDAGVGAKVDEDDLSPQPGRCQRRRVEPARHVAERIQLTFTG